MRDVRHVSYSSKKLFYEDRDDYVLRYLCINRPPREPANKYMVIGSAFDAYVKSRLADDLFGADSKPEYDFDLLFETQIEEQFRDIAKPAGEYVLAQYIASGFYGNLLEMMQGAQTEPKFEFNACGTIKGVPIFGKPDCFFLNKDNIPVILDWKVRGFYAKKGPSPTKNYRLCLDGDNWLRQSLSHGKAHKGFVETDYLGSGKLFLEESSTVYADQLSMYGWIVGLPVGDESVVCCIDEALGKPTVNGEGYPHLRFAQQRARISAGYQRNLMDSLKIMWDSVKTGHIYFEMGRDYSDRRVETMEMRSRGMVKRLGEKHG